MRFGALQSIGVIAMLKWLKAKKLGWALAFGPKEGRPATARAMADLGPSAISELIAALQHDEDVAVCIAAAESLGRIGDPQSVDQMMARLWAGPDLLSVAIFNASRVCNENETSRLLARKFLRDDERTSQVARRFLLQLGVTAIEPLRRVLSDECPEGLARACGLLEELGAPLENDEQRLMAAISRKRFAVAAAMGSLGIAAVLEFIRRSNVEVAEAVTADLAHAGAVESLVVICEDQTLSRFRHIALAAIATIGDPKAIPSLVSTASHTSDDEVRLALMSTLSGLGDRAIRELAGLLEHPAEELQNAAARALSQPREGRRVFDSAAIPANTYPTLARVNIRRWTSSGEPKAWVSAHQGRWHHQDWLALLDGLRSTSYWPMNEPDIGRILEETRASYFRELVRKLEEAVKLEHDTRRFAARFDELRRRDSGRASEISRLGERYERSQDPSERESLMNTIEYLTTMWGGLTDDYNRAKQAESDLPRVRERLKGLERECSHPVAVGPAVERLADGSFEVQVAMALLLSRIGDPRGTAWLQSCMGRSIRPEYQAAVEEALRELEANGQH